MDAYAKTQQIIVKQVQTELRAEAAAIRLAAKGARHNDQASAEGLVHRLAGRLITIAPGS